MANCYEECTDTLTWTDALTGAACSPDDGNDLCVSHTASSGVDGTALWVEEHDFFIPETTLKPEQFTTEAFDGLSKKKLSDSIFIFIKVTTMSFKIQAVILLMRLFGQIWM